MGAVGEMEGGGGLVADFQAFEMDDAHEIIAALPDLALLKFHSREGISPAFYFKRDGIANVTLLFLAGDLFGGYGRMFLGGDAGVFGTFLAGFFLVRFRGSISHDVYLSLTAVDWRAE
jgi:hypothetical protein